MKVSTPGSPDLPSLYGMILFRNRSHVLRGRFWAYFNSYSSRHAQITREQRSVSVAPQGIETFDP